MSHWQTGKLSLACSMAVLKRALLNIMPEWEQHIQEDANSGLSAENHYGFGTKTGYKIVIKLRTGDIGFKQGPDNTWTADYDSMSIPGTMRRSGGMDGAVLQEVSAMRARAIAQLNGLQVVGDRMSGDDRIIEILAPVGKEAIRV